MRDIWPLNEEEGAPIETLAADECWTIGPLEERLARLKVALDGSQGWRVRLRDLFARRLRTLLRRPSVGVQMINDTVAL